MPILLLVIVGAAAGFLATRFMKLDADVPTTVAIGIFGALVGGLILRALITMASWAAGFVGAVMGAMLLIWLWRRWAGRR
ncbi:GlsB/YeaQ/YmgE family stress response membrane protein [Gemmobacter nectariphilus]|uniref:GlsB/YeaQ/YmgE family stress response membrane protein n=1 Tax=Gemmobacter nectariphilus TaxID=220343 RepID=UPI00041B6616|nr:GlsB/YeaQ/YmgE family stress response membrane protein [Gemmobacter nectariphilus]